MANLVEPEEILYHFLRSRLSEITRTGVANRLSIANETFNGTGSQTAFVLTNIPDSIGAVTVDAVTMYPYKDFNINLDAKTITFLTAPASGTDNVDITYKTGTSWIYPDTPRDNLTKNSYPRIAVIPITESSQQQSIAEDDTYDTISFQIDVLSYKDQECTIGGASKYDNDVSRYLARQVKKTIKSDWRLYMNTELFQPVFLSNNPIPFEPSKNVFRNMLEVNFNSFNTGE